MTRELRALVDGAGIPSELETPLKFCPCDEKACCDDDTEEARLQIQFQELNVTDPKCASLLKSILCAVSILIIGVVFHI